MGRIVSTSNTQASLFLPSPSTPSARFARDVTAGLTTRIWVEEVIGRRLPEGDFASGFKDGQGLCELINTFCPGTIPKIERSASPFHQMANISCFLKACRTLGVREQVLFETLDLFEENRLPQVVRCLFSLSELVRTTPSITYDGPYLAGGGKPDIDPSVLHLIDISKGNVVMAPAYGPVTPGAASMGSDPSGIGVAKQQTRGGAALEVLALPNHVNEITPGGRCLSPAAHEAGKLTFGVYEGGGGGRAERPKSLPRPARVERKTRPRAGAFGVEGKEAALAQLQAQALTPAGKSGTGAARWGGDAGGAVAAVANYAESALSVMNTPTRAMVTPSAASPTPRAESDGDGDGDGEGGLGVGKAALFEEQARRRREAIAQYDAEMEVALWIEGVTGETFPGKFWSSLKDGALLCNALNSIKPGLVPHINTSRGTFPELENITAFLCGCREVGVAEHSLFDTKDLHEKRDMQAVVRCLHVLGAAVQTTVPEFRGPFLGKKSEALSQVNARRLRKRLGKGPGAKGGITSLTAPKSGAGEQHASLADVPIEHPDPTATMTPAESPSVEPTSHRREAASDSAPGSGVQPAITPGSPRAIAEGLPGVVLPAVIFEEEAGMTSPVLRVQRQSRRGARRVIEEVGKEGRNLAGLFKDAASATPGEADRGGVLALRRGVSEANSSMPGSGATVREQQQLDDDVGSEGAVAQIQRFVELRTNQPWRVSGNIHESLRDGWQLALLANALRPGAVWPVHNSIQPAKHVENIRRFLKASRRMGVARALLFDVEDLHENKSETRVARTLLALRALAADPDFARGRPLMGTSLLEKAATAAGAAMFALGPPSTASADGRRL